MVSTPEQRRRYRQKYPEKVKEQRKRYYDKKVRERIKDDPKHLEKLKGRLLHQFDRLTSLTFRDKLPGRCRECGEERDLHIHHIRYLYPIKASDLKVLCRECQMLEHQKTPPPQNKRDTLVSYGKRQKDKRVY